MNELKIVDFSKKYFECDGRKFYLKDTLSFNRYRELQKLILEFGFSATFVDIFKNLRMAIDLGNSGKPIDGFVIVYKVLEGIISMEQKYDSSWRLCALFIDEEGEDVTQMDEGKMSEKIDCWNKECDVTPFFQLASRLVPFWINAYRIVLKDGSIRVEKRKE